MNLKRGPTASLELECRLPSSHESSVATSPTASEPRREPAHVSDAKWAVLTVVVGGCVFRDSTTVQVFN